MKVEENDTSVLAPPRKKLKQARLPFQILSPVSAVSSSEKTNKKRKLSEGSEDEIKVVKVVKPNGINPHFESKENLQVPIKEPITCKSKAEAKSSDNNEASVIDLDEEESSDHISAESAESNTENEKNNSLPAESSELMSLKSDECNSKAELNKDNASETELNFSDKVVEPAQNSQNVDKIEDEHKNELKITKSSVVGTSFEGECSSDSKAIDSDSKVVDSDSKVVDSDSEAVDSLAPEHRNHDKNIDETKEEIITEEHSSSVDNSCDESLTPAKVSTNLKDTVSPTTSQSESPETKTLCTPDQKILKKSRTKRKVTPATDKGNNLNDSSCSESVTPSGDTPDGISSHGSTPTHKTPLANRKLTPKQLMKQAESAKKKEEKERLKQEREKKKAEEREEKQREKLKKVEEKEKKKLAELEAQRLKSEQKKKEKEEKEKKKAAELELKSEEKRQKEEERRKKEEMRLLEKRKKEEKRLAEEEAKKKEEEVKKKEAAAFTSFFVPVKADSKPAEEVKVVEHFMPFEVKADMRLAPKVRSIFDSKRREALEEALNQQSEERLYLDELAQKSYAPRSCGQTWPLSEMANEVYIIDDDDDMLGGAENNVVIDRHPLNNMPRPKLLQFWDNRRPPYWGTWRKRSPFVKPRAPFGKDEKLFDYEVDSDEEWEEEEPGESLHGSDDEKESEDEYEVDNDFFVPHGYLSEEENEHEEDEKVSPETMKAKLKLLEIEFQEEMKQKTECIKPRVIGCIWLNNNTDHVGSRLMQLLSSHRAVFRDKPIVTSVPESESRDNSPPKENVPGPKKRKFPEEATPALIKLIHGNVNGRVFLVKEFLAYLKKEAACSNTDGSITEEVKSEVFEKDGANFKPETPEKDGASVKSESSEKNGANVPANDTGISKKSIANKIKELSSWIPCPEEGVMQGRSCWYVPAEIRASFGLEDFKLPNKSWSYCLVPKRELDFSNPVTPPAPTCEVIEKPTKVLPLITKFTKKMTSEELQKQLLQSPGDNMKGLPNKKHTPKLAGCKTQKRLHSFIPKETHSSLPADKPRKRVPILMSVSVGHEIPKLHESKKSETSLSPKPSSSNSHVTSAKTDDKEIDCVVLSD
ncbi:chromatin assembly factor 1 subunit A-B [Anabrus simplex]|uniref:chromatin assembly factor 1 subunit A-B n=1 Tax=Anabrus simplex TaxID=316456 RepID=UPI0035A3923B